MHLTTLLLFVVVLVVGFGALIVLRVAISFDLIRGLVF
jgi:hypothetical protein